MQPASEGLLTLLDLTLEAVGCRVRIRCLDTTVAALVRAAYGSLLRAEATADVTYTAAAQADGGFSLHCAGRERLIAADDSEFLMVLETELSIELQTRRPDLFFIHGAALEDEGRAVLLVGASGAGKSTAAWGLTHAGFGYLSDELSPLDLETLEVAPYPRALCLKAEPPASHPVPSPTLRTVRTLHISPSDMLRGGVAGPVPVHAIFFVDHRQGTRWPSVEPVTRGEAAARLLAQALNPLAHADDGLEAASRIASAIPAFRLSSAALHPTSALVKTALASVGVIASR